MNIGQFKADEFSRTIQLKEKPKIDPQNSHTFFLNFTDTQMDFLIYF